jgi:predicted cupin superfamily sugar epimerase
MHAEELIRKLSLLPHPEGGYYRETYRAGITLSKDALPEPYSGDRAAATCIYYLLVPGTFSCLHRLVTDEVFHFYAGDPVQLLQLDPTGAESKVTILGNKLDDGQVPQVVVPAGIWQGCRLAPGGEFALMGCTVSPGFEFADYEEGAREVLCQEYQGYAELITELTRK